MASETRALQEMGRYVEQLEAERDKLEEVLEEALAEFTAHAISELPHIAYGYGKARDWLRRRLLRVPRRRRGSWVTPQPELGHRPTRMNESKGG